MSEFGNMIKALAPPKSTVREIAMRVDIDHTNLSRIMTSGRRSLQPETLSRICLRLTPNREKQAELLAAYLRDLRIPSLASLVEIKVTKGGEKGRKDSDPETPAHVLCALAEKLDPAAVLALCRIAQNLGNRSLRRAILGLGEVAAGAKAE